MLSSSCVKFFALRFPQDDAKILDLVVAKVEGLRRLSLGEMVTLVQPFNVRIDVGFYLFQELPNQKLVLPIGGYPFKVAPLPPEYHPLECLKLLSDVSLHANALWESSRLIGRIDTLFKG